MRDTTKIKLNIVSCSKGKDLLWIQRLLRIGQLLEITLKSGWRNYLQDARLFVTRIPEGMPLLARLKIRSPRLPKTTSPPSLAPIRPSITKLYSSSFRCRCRGAASAHGSIGCSTSEKRASESLPSIINRTPVNPSWQDLPSSDLKIRDSLRSAFIDKRK